MAEKRAYKPKHLFITLVVLICASCTGINTKSVPKSSNSTTSNGLNDLGLLLSITCPMPKLCKAVDSGGKVYTFRDGKWSKGLQIRTSAKATYHSISCASSNFCMAVGGLSFGQVGGLYSVYVNGSWSGTIYGGKLPPFFDSVACPKTNFCIAVSSIGKAYVYNNETWSNATRVVKPDQVDYSQDGSMALYSISCPQVNFCMAIGTDGYEYVYNHGSWMKGVLIDPHLINGSALLSVSCLSMTSCIAGGENGYVYIYTNGSWKGSQVLTNGLLANQGIYAVSCMRNENCVALSHNGYAYMFLDGTWSGGKLIDPNGMAGSIVCPQINTCMAVDEIGYIVTYHNGAWSQKVRILEAS